MNSGFFRGLIIAAAVSLVPVVVKDQYFMHLLITTAIYAIMASGLNLILGYTGNLSLGQPAFYGIGAYTSALLNLNLGLSFWGGMLAAIVFTALLGILVGILSLRVRGSSFTVMTFAFLQVAHLAALNLVNVTRGEMGLSRIAPPSITLPFMETFVFTSRTSFFYLAAGLLLIVVWGISRLINSRVGRAWQAIRENEDLARSLGVNVHGYSLLAFVIGAGLAGLAGSMYAHYTLFISPSILEFQVMISLLVMVVVGGKGTVVGPILGAIVFTVVPEVLRVADDFRLPILGALLTMAVLFMPQGILPAVQGLFQKRGGAVARNA